MTSTRHGFGKMTVVKGSQKSVILRAPVLTQSGYGVHSRQIARWLLNRSDVDLTIKALRWGITPWFLSHEQQDGFIGKMLEKCRGEDGAFDVSIQVQLPNEWDPKLASFNVGITAGVETDRCNPKWIDCCNAMDLVIVPSKHAKACFENVGGLTTKITVVPESFPDCFAAETVQPLDIDLEAEFNFLIVGQFTGNSHKNDRKKLRETIHWLCQQFDGDPATGIVIKANMGRNTRIDRNLCKNLLKGILPERKDGLPRVHMLHGTLTEAEMAGLYRHPKVKAYVTCTRGEGFGLPVLEAAVSGLPVIATHWSGYLDFMSQGRFIKLDYKLCEIPGARVDGEIFVPGTKWAEVQEEDFKKKVAKIRKSHRIPQEWASDLRKKLLKGYSHKRICELYVDALGGVL